MKRPPGQGVRATKIDAAEQQIKAAVRLFFEGKNLVPIYTLANAAREVVTSVGKHLEIETVQENVAKARGTTAAELIRPLVKIANFFKHADRDPAAKIAFIENDVEIALYFACHDFGRVAGGMPIEAQVYEAWVHAAATERVSDLPFSTQKPTRQIIAAFPGLRRAPDRAAQKRIGLEIMERALRDKSLEMTIKREVPVEGR
jgi:hypothetical protein